MSSSSNLDLAVWMQGAAAIIGERLPTPLEWEMIKDKVDRTIAVRIADRLAEQQRGSLLKYEPHNIGGYPMPGVPGVVGNYQGHAGCIPLSELKFGGTP